MIPFSNALIDYPSNNLSSFTAIIDDYNSGFDRFLVNVQPYLDMADIYMTCRLKKDLWNLWLDKIPLTQVVSTLLK